MINNYDNYGEIIYLQETLIDLMFDYIEDKEILLNNIVDKDLIYFKNSVNQTFNINIIYKQSNSLHAQFENPNMIIIFLPSNYHNITGNQLLKIFLHELSHYFTSRRVPDYIIKKKKLNNRTLTQKLKNRLLHPPNQNIPWDNGNIDLIKQYLDYVFQSKELPNFALTFSLSFLDTKEDINLFFNDNLLIIKNKLNSQFTVNQLISFYETIGDSDLQLLFQIQYFVQYLKLSKYQRKLIQLKKLIKKYYRRLLKYY